MKTRLYDSAALARIGYNHRIHLMEYVPSNTAAFRADLDAALDQFRLDWLNLTEHAAWRLIQRFLGSQCPANAADALTCLGLLDNTVMVCIDLGSGEKVFEIRRGDVVLDSERVPSWKGE